MRLPRTFVSGLTRSGNVAYFLLEAIVVVLRFTVTSRKLPLRRGCWMDSAVVCPPGRQTDASPRTDGLVNPYDDSGQREVVRSTYYNIISGDCDEICTIIGGDKYYEQTPVRERSGCVSGKLGPTLTGQTRRQVAPSVELS